MTSLLRFYFVLARAPKKGRVFLDVGCGKGHLGAFLRVHSPKAEIIGLDIWMPYLKITKKTHLYDDLIRCDITHLPIKEKSSNFTCAVELIEHLSKDKGISFLKDLKKITDGRIVITTPRGYKKHPKSEDLFQEHLSGWNVNELRKMGFKVRGIFPSFQNKLYLILPLALFWFFPALAPNLIAIMDSKRQNVDNSLEEK